MTDKGNLVNFARARVKKRHPTAKLLSEELQRLEPLKVQAKEFADRMRDGEMGNAYAMELSMFLNVPRENLNELYFFLDEVDKLLCPRER